MSALIELLTVIIQFLQRPMLLFGEYEVTMWSVIIVTAIAGIVGGFFADLFDK